MRNVTKQLFHGPELQFFKAEALEESAQIAPKLDALRFERLCEFALLNRSITTYE